MTKVRDFVAGLARAGKTYKEIKETTEAAYGDQALKKTQIYEVMKKVKAGKNTEDQRHLSAKKTASLRSLQDGCPSFSAMTRKKRE